MFAKQKKKVGIGAGMGRDARSDGSLDTQAGMDFRLHMLLVGEGTMRILYPPLVMGMEWR